MLRRPHTPELFHAPPEFLCGGPRAKAVALPLGGQVSPVLLRRYARRMAQRGTPVQLARMGYDRLYAFECLARAHACEDDALRGLALALFDAFERRA